MGRTNGGTCKHARKAKAQVKTESDMKLIGKSDMESPGIGCEPAHFNRVQDLIRRSSVIDERKDLASDPEILGLILDYVAQIDKIDESENYFIRHNRFMRRGN